MVKIAQKENALASLGTGKVLYQCEECGLKYEQQETAKKCQAWCKEHKSCNLEIIENAVKD